MAVRRVRQEIKINLYKPHRAQVPIHDAIEKYRFVIATCGRRFGKTHLCSNEIAKHSWSKARSKTLWVAPFRDQANLGFQIVKNQFDKYIHKSIQSPMNITWKNGSMTEFRSTENHGGLKGRGVDFMVVDEASRVSAEAWQESLRPMLSDTNGKAVIVSTPLGRNWFYEIFLRGDNEDYPQYKSFKLPTSSNPFIHADEIEEARLSLPEDIFKQEYLAEFLDDGGQVFKSVTECINPSLSERGEPSSGHSYILAWDVAKHSDYSCIVVMSMKTKELVYFDRFNRIDYTDQVNRVERIANKFRCRIIMDSTGVGDPVLEQVKLKGLKVEGFNFNNKSKQQVIENLAVMMEKKEISYPNIPVLINELMSYQYEITRAGNITYNAPSNMHDDTVIALSLACWKIKNQKLPRFTRVF